jgi:hypothetical protein
MADPDEIAKFGKRLQINATIGLAVSQAFAWSNFLAYNRHTGFPFNPPGIIVTIFVASYATYFAIRIAQNARRFTWVVGAVLLNAFLLLIVDFAGFYWRFGTTPNFNVTLSRLDSLYFTLGTLTTAGTGSITPQSQVARGLVSVQMVLDLILIAVALAIAVARLSERFSKPTPVTDALIKILTEKTKPEGSKQTTSSEVSNSNPSSNLPPDGTEGSTVPDSAT